MNWNGERVLVTGGASFIRSHLFEDVVAGGANVRVVDDFFSGEAENLEPSKTRSKSSVVA